MIEHQPQSSVGTRQHASLWSLTKGFRLRYSLAIASMAVGIVLVFLVPQITKHVIDGFSESAQGGYTYSPPQWMVNALATFGIEGTLSSTLWLAGGLTLGLTALAGLFQYLRGRLAAQASEGILLRLRRTVYARLMELPSSFFDKSDTGDLVQRCTSDVETVRLFLSAQVVELGRSVLLVACSVPMLFALDTRLTWVTLGLLPFIVGYSLVFFRRITRIFKAVDEAEGEMTTVVQENLTGIRVVRSFGRQDYEIEKFAAANETHRTKTVELLNVLAIYWSLSDILCLTQAGLVLFFGGYWTLTGDISLGTMVAFTQYSALIIWPVRQMGRTLIDAGKARVSLKRLREILTHPVETAGDQISVQPEALTGEIRVRDLTYSFDRIEDEGSTPEHRSGPDRPILSDLSFEIPAGQTVALLGPPGSGKSVLIQLLLRLYDYEQGSIQLDGIELRDLPRHFVRQQIGVVMQDPFLYAKTIESNLRVGHSAAQEDVLHAATRAAAIHDSIEGFELGYQTMLGERGVTLSGGQKQRVAIARALLKDSPILILDDALSAVDTETEQHILKGLKKRRRRHTTLIVAHRLSSVAHADQILVMNAGRIVERGSHAELLAQNGSYARLWAMQSQWSGAGDAPDPTPVQTAVPLNPTGDLQ
ncbi:MAG: ABC transporter ATP-binding protein [Planctomycetes bacterium]|nr:ABC transporter ATP-binding protein [Planctomycetota bacterium]